MRESTMVTQPLPTPELLSETPLDLGRRIVSGMRWTLWLSVLAPPFSYGITVLLARAGTEVIGTYGFLMVYIGVLSSLFYRGGDAVAIRFIPELGPGKRPAFLAIRGLSNWSFGW